MRELYSIADVVGPRFFNDWKGEQNYFLYLQAESLKRFMSLWDYNFVGWPDYSEHPLRKPEIAARVEEEFRSPRSSVHPFLLPKPEAIAMFEDVAVTQYFWRETDDTRPSNIGPRTCGRKDQRAGASLVACIAQCHVPLTQF